MFYFATGVDFKVAQHGGFVWFCRKVQLLHIFQSRDTKVFLRIEVKIAEQQISKRTAYAYGTWDSLVTAEVDHLGCMDSQVDAS